MILETYLSFKAYAFPKKVVTENCHEIQHYLRYFFRSLSIVSFPPAY